MDSISGNSIGKSMAIADQAVWNYVSGLSEDLREEVLALWENAKEALPKCSEDCILCGEMTSFFEARNE